MKNNKCQVRSVGIARHFFSATILFGSAIFASSFANAARLKDIASIRGARENQLVGYGLVVGLAGTGDSKTEFTSRSMFRMLDSVGLKLDGKEVSSKNVAAVMITATLPAFARSGNKLDITVSAIGDAASLEGGTLIQTPLHAANQQVYAVAQGSVSVGTNAAGKTFGTGGRITSGALVEKEMEQNFADRKMLRMSLENADFTTAARATKVINEDLGGKYASSKDGGTIDIIVPPRYEGNAVEFLALIENLQVATDIKAKVVINEKTGTVIMGDHVRVSKIALSHGNLSVQVGTGTTLFPPKSGTEKNAPVSVRGPASVDGASSSATSTANSKSKDQKADHVILVEGDASVGDLVKALNTLGVTPKDLITILQNLKSAGALQADVEVL